MTTSECLSVFALDQWKTTLRAWLNKMADAHTPGDELALYILARMYRGHVYVYTQMFWWTTLLYTLPVTEQELLSQCKIVLVYVKDGIYGELEKIRGPATKSAQSTDHDIRPVSSNIDGKNNLAADEQNYSVNIENELSKSNYDITGSTPAEMGKHVNEVVTPESAFNRQDHDDTQSNPMTMQASHNPKSGSVIPENAVPAEDVPLDPLNNDSTGHPKATLPGIDVFLSRTCTIPLVRCDFDLIKKAVKTQDKQNKESERQNEEASTEAPNPNKPVLAANTDANEVRTSSCKCTVIDYKKFLEEFADIPPSPPKKKRS